MSKIVATTTDEKARVSIIEDIKTNIFVEAGAGSGKTTMLVNRMVAMIEADIPVEKICAITFTKNAALEFYERFQAKLIERSNPNNNEKPKHPGDLDVPTDITRNRCAKALENIDLCFMGTIDSFCNMILSEHPMEANIPSDARLLSKEEALELYKQFYVGVRKGKYGKKLKELSDRFNMFFWDVEETFAYLISEIMDKRNVTFHYDEDLCIDFYKCFSKQREDIKKVLNKFLEDPSKIVLPLKKDDDSDPLDVFNSSNATIQKGWDYNYKGVESALEKIKNVRYEGSCDELGFTNESVVRDVEGGTRVELNIADPETQDALIFKLKNYKYQNTLKFLLECVPHLEELMRANGKFTFFDYLYYLRNMLVTDSKKDGKLIEYIYNRHSYFLIDEFQDTNPMQAEIFFYLAAKDPKQLSWKDCKPKDGALFIVGDPKQSIYRFRSADVSSYLGIKKIFENNKDNCAVRYLANNFRSKNVVKQYFNNVFEEVMPEDTLEQSKYQDILNDNVEEVKEFDGIYSYISYSDSAAREYPDMIDSIRIVKIIMSIMNSDKQIIENDKESKYYGQLRKIKYSDFMVILYGKKNIGKLIESFNLNSIPSRVEGKVLFSKCDGLNAITSIYKTVTEINDAISLVETLKCKVFGYNDNDLSAYRKIGNDIRLDLTKEYSATGIEETFKKLSNTAKIIYRHTPSSLYEYIIDEYEIFKYVSSESLEIVYYVLELIRGEEHSGNIITYKDAVNYMNDLLNDESALERCLSLRQGIDAVHIANLHKVKGLEAPIVILAKSGKNNNKKGNIRIEYDEDPTTKNTIVNGYISSIKDPTNDYYNSIETDAFKDFSEKEKTSLENEVDRLIYVAATRARNVLIVNNAYRRYGKSQKYSSSGKSNSWHYLVKKTQDDIFNVVPENETPIKDEGDVVYANDLYNNVELTKLESSETYHYKKPSDIKNNPRTDEAPIVEDTNDNNDNGYAKTIGTIVHRLMEMMIMSKDKLSKDDLVNNILDEYVAEKDIDHKNDFKLMLEKIYDVMHSGGYPQVNDAPQDILPMLMDDNVQAFSEVPFSFKDDKDTIWNGIIDLLYVKDDKYHIIDWKTNKNGIGLDEHYKDQLEDYKYAVEQSLNIKVEDALIYHLMVK